MTASHPLTYLLYLHFRFLICIPLINCILVSIIADGPVLTYNYLSNRNSVENVLLSCGVFVCLSGIKILIHKVNEDRFEKWGTYLVQICFGCHHLAHKISV